MRVGRHCRQPHAFALLQTPASRTVSGFLDLDDLVRAGTSPIQQSSLPMADMSFWVLDKCVSRRPIGSRLNPSSLRQSGSEGHVSTTAFSARIEQLHPLVRAPAGAAAV